MTVTADHPSVVYGALLSLLPILLCLLSLLTIAARAGEEWHSADEFTLEGNGWTDTEAPYDRLPARAKGRVPPPVWDLSKQSAGMCVRFQTDSRLIAVRWTLTGRSLALPHMPATGVSGVDLYRKGTDGRWRFVQNGRPGPGPENTAPFDTGGPPGRMQEYLLYLPLYNGVRSLEIGAAPGTPIRKAALRPAARRRPLVFYGTSIVQGACASRPGMAHAAILGRRLDQPVINLGFSGSGRMEPEMAALLAELAPAVFVIDCLANMPDLSEDQLAGRVTGLVHTIRRARPDTPILCVGQSSFQPEKLPTAASRVQEAAVQRLMAEDVPGLYLIGGESLLGADGEGTVDGSHPNDLGMMRHADALYPVLTAILQRRPRRAAAVPSDPRA